MTQPVITVTIKDPITVAQVSQYLANRGTTMSGASIISKLQMAGVPTIARPTNGTRVFWQFERANALNWADEVVRKKQEKEAKKQGAAKPAEPVATSEINHLVEIHERMGLMQNQMGELTTAITQQFSHLVQLTAELKRINDVLTQPTA